MPSKRRRPNPVGHEQAARESSKHESWLEQLLRSLRLSTGRPGPQASQQRKPFDSAD
jgi:hypothetical protein